MNYLLSEIATITNGRLIGDDRSVSAFLTDTRRILNPRESIFIAIPGERHDGHDYVDDAIAAGVHSFIVSGVFKSTETASYILVEHSLHAFQQLAEYHRAQFDYPVIGITGSYGKTTVKDRLANVLRSRYSIVRSPRSFNSQTGVPLSVMAMDTGHELGIFEAGISLSDEMVRIAAIIQPDIGILTTLGAAHDEGFKNRNEKLAEKLDLYESCSIIIYRRDDETVHQAINQRFGTTEKVLFHWGYHEESALHILGSSAKDSGYEVDYCTGGASHQVFIEAVSEMDLNNGIQILCTLHVLGCGASEIALLLAKDERHGTDSRIVATDYGKGLLTDIGPIDGPSIRTAQERMDSLLDHRGIHTILIDESMSPIANDRRLEELIRELDGHTVHCIGENLRHLHESISGSSYYIDAADFIESSSHLTTSHSAILLHGPLSPQLIALRSHLEQQGHQTQVTVNLQALVQNLNAYRSLLQPGTKVMAMVKAFAYGSGDSEVARILQYHKVDYLAVAYADEGITLRKQGVDLPIMVMNSSPREFADLVRYRLEPEIYSMKMLHSFLEYLESNALENYPIHLKFDTGMHRLGFERGELEAVVELLVSQKRIDLRSVFSHLFSSEADDTSLAERQISLLQNIRVYFEQHWPKKILFHILNSAGISRFPEARMDMVRLGVGLYGLTGDKDFEHRLLPVIGWTTVISQIKEVEAGETVGYGGVFRLEKAARIAILPVGYADGISRRLGNGSAYVYIQDKRCPFVGNICMDMSMVDLSDLDCSPGDTVELIGSHIGIEELATAQGTIGYEVLTSIPPRVKRSYVFEG